MRYRIIASLVILAAGGSAVFADWLQFRGPGGQGIAPDKNVPTVWSDDANIAWKTEMPGPGASSPIIVGDRVFVTCYSGYGVDQENPGEQKGLKRHLVCVERKTGKIAWQRELAAATPEPDYRSFITLHGYASSTPVSDGKNVYAFFGRSGVYAYDLDGKQLWQASVGDGTYYWGVGPSPILYKDLVIVNASTESGALVALDKSTGKEVWRAKGIKSSWNTPVLVKRPEGGTELVVATQPTMMGFDPDNGKELWRAETYNWYVCPSLAVHDGVLYGLQHSICVAVKSGGRGDVSPLWKKTMGAVVTSPLVFEGHLYWAWNGTAYCVKTSDGSVVYKERLKGAGSEFYPSPVLADGKIYYATRSHGTFVVDAGPQFKLVAHNQFKSDDSICNATPAISGSQIYLRSNRYLYCIGKTK